jgi:uncharacterized membrane protein YgcG
MSFRHIPRVVLVIAVLSTGGCSVVDPFARAGTWNPAGVNHDNLVTMVAVPADLARGVGSSSTDAALPAAALDRLRQGKVLALPDSTIVDIANGGSAGGSGGGSGSGSGSGSGGAGGGN